MSSDVFRTVLLVLKPNYTHYKYNKESQNSILSPYIRDFAKPTKSKQAVQASRHNLEAAIPKPSTHMGVSENRGP